MKRVLIAAALLSFVLGATPANAAGAGTYNERYSSIQGGGNNLLTLHSSWFYYDGNQEAHAHCQTLNEGNPDGGGVYDVVINKCNAVSKRGDGSTFSTAVLPNGPVSCPDTHIWEYCTGNSQSFLVSYLCSTYPNMTFEVHDKITLYYRNGTADTDSHDAGHTSCTALGL